MAINNFAKIFRFRFRENRREIEGCVFWVERFPTIALPFAYFFAPSIVYSCVRLSTTVLLTLTTSIYLWFFTRYDVVDLISDVVDVTFLRGQQISFVKDSRPDELLPFSFERMGVLALVNNGYLGLDEVFGVLPVLLFLVANMLHLLFALGNVIPQVPREDEKKEEVSSSEERKLGWPENHKDAINGGDAKAFKNKIDQLLPMVDNNLDDRVADQNLKGRDKLEFNEIKNDDDSDDMRDLGEVDNDGDDDNDYDDDVPDIIEDDDDDHVPGPVEVEEEEEIVPDLGAYDDDDDDVPGLVEVEEEKKDDDDDDDVPDLVENGDDDVPDLVEDGDDDVPGLVEAEDPQAAGQEEDYVGTARDLRNYNDTNSVRPENTVEGNNSDEMMKFNIVDPWVLDDTKKLLDAMDESYANKLKEEKLHWEKQLKQVAQKYEEDRQRWENEKQNLVSKLWKATAKIDEFYRTIYLKHEESRLKWEEDKNDLIAQLSYANASAEVYKTLLHDLFTDSQ